MKRILLWFLSWFRRPVIVITGDPCWEAVPDEDGVMWRVRWSQPDDHGRYLWVGHYPTENVGQHMAERHAERFNEQCRCPWEWDCYHK